MTTTIRSTTQHRWVYRGDGSLVCRWCAMRAEWPGARQYCRSVVLQATRRKSAKARERGQIKESA